ncbi:hypothetical protein HYU06_05885 [Candidatus Woesearchaeota archaeon]|nr:hypothetical protein [Candidatus Woesearchaeota archaeon]
MKYKRIYLGAGITLTGLITILSILGFVITGTDDKCAGTYDDPCESFLTFKNTKALSVYIYNPNDIKLSFSPEDCVASYNMYVDYYGKWVYTNFTNKTRLSNIPSSAKYVFVFPQYSTKKFKLELYKIRPDCVIKFNVSAGNYVLDPVFDRPDNLYYNVCEPVYETTTYQEPVYAVNTIYIAENDTYKNITYISKYERKESKIQVSCTDKSYVDVKTSVYNVSKVGLKCSIVKTRIECDCGTGDSNCDGKCQNGESCVNEGIGIDVFKKQMENKWQNSKQ